MAAAAAPKLSFAPQSALASAAAMGTDRLDVHNLPGILKGDYDGDWFLPGDEILVAPGTDREERHTVAGFGPLKIAGVLAYDHDPDTMVVLVNRPKGVSTLTATYKKGAFKGKVSAGTSKCISGRKILVTKGKKKIGQTKANKKGVWKIKKKKVRKGKYKVTAKPKSAGGIDCFIAWHQFKK